MNRRKHMKKDHYDKLIEEALKKTRTYSDVFKDANKLLEEDCFNGKDNITIILSQEDYTLVVLHRALFGNIIIDAKDIRFLGHKTRVSTRDRKPTAVFTDQFGDGWEV